MQSGVRVWPYENKLHHRKASVYRAICFIVRDRSCLILDLACMYDLFGQDVR